jgi:hypothetical protein
VKGRKGNTKMKFGLTYHFLRWISFWGMFATGLVGVLTLGFVCRSIELKTCKWFLDYCEKETFLKTSKKL